MAKEKPEDDILSAFEADAPADGGDLGLDDQIDDLRGVLQNDAEGTVPDLDSMVGGDLSDFGGDFGGDAAGGDFGSDLGGDFGSGDFGGGNFGGNSDFGGDSFGSTSLNDIAPPGSALHANYDLIMDIPIDVQIVLGTSHMNVATLMNLSEGATIALDRKIGEPVEILVNGRLIGRGEIAVLDEDNTRFGVKLIEIMKIQNKS
ncbi:flagellar motor switch protein FliN [Rhizobium sp. L1K21]|uniref:flagellar motor switch protein FliN n=1 Tax=Rhizobium sp. L1K21 TaxID=2954933 RepID=UPI0020928527|nr:flagellar motor switch protein FliN [Rhizobium sp. L1K21]MCO6187134.1 flagellar motor switch protein FliN [Rhizobium sp. L1K21]